MSLGNHADKLKHVGHCGASHPSKLQIALHFQQRLTYE